LDLRSFTPAICATTNGGIANGLAQLHHAPARRCSLSPRNIVTASTTMFRRIGRHGTGESTVHSVERIVMKTTWWSKIPSSLRALAVAGVLSLTITAPSPAGDISYVYDNLGRVLAVIDPATDTAVYQYDAVGNLTGITRQASSTLAIFQFTPAVDRSGLPSRSTAPASAPRLRPTRSSSMARRRRLRRPPPRC
jgi:YD repeat-containing protein